MQRDAESAPAASRLTTRGARALLLHPVRVLRRLLAEHSSPRGLAAAGAYGAVIGAFPLIGLHTVLTIVGAKRLRLNRLVALGTCQLGFPPVVPALCIETGYYLRHGTLLTEVSMHTLWSEALERFWEWMLGACIVGPALATAVALAIYAVADGLRRSAAGASAAGGEKKAAPAGQP